MIRMSWTWQSGHSTSGGNDALCVELEPVAGGGLNWLPLILDNGRRRRQDGVGGRRGTPQGQASDDGNGVRENEEGEGRRMDASCSVLSN